MLKTVKLTIVVYVIFCSYDIITILALSNTNQMALIITKSSEAHSALAFINLHGIETIERLDGIEVADDDALTVSEVLAGQYIVHVVEY